MDLFAIFLLILLNGLFSMSEIAVVSSRFARLQKLARSGNRSAQAVLGLKSEPVAFFSTVQIGITMVGILSGTIGETAMVDPLTDWFTRFHAVEPYARGLAMTATVVILTYVSVVVGELVPKQLGLIAPEKIAVAIAVPMRGLAFVAQPLIWLLSASSKMVLEIFRQDGHKDPPVTNAEIRLLMEQGAEAGVFHASERIMVANVLRLDEQSIRAIMTPRQDIYLVDLNNPESDVHRNLAECPFSRAVVCRGGLERIVGILRLSDLAKDILVGQTVNVEAHVQPPVYLWEGVTTTQLIEKIKEAGADCALVVDEYGEVQGLATLSDVFTSIIGDMSSSRNPDEHEFVERDDGSWLVDGGVPIDRLKVYLNIDDVFPGERKKAYLTAGGLMIYLLGKIPREGDSVEQGKFRFEIVDMDHNRVDKVLVSLLEV
jgi:putative hemolysin